MAKKTTYTATHELTGKTYTRTTARTYTHMVLKRVDIATERAQLEAVMRDVRKRNLPYYTKLAAGIHEIAAQFPAQYTPERIAKDIAEAKAWLAEDIDAQVAEALIEFDNKPHIVEAAERGYYFYDNGWTGRYELALKLAKLGDAILAVSAK